MIKKRLEPFKDEFRRLTICEGYNDYEAMAIILMKWFECIIPMLFIILYILTRQNNRTK